MKNSEVEQEHEKSQESFNKFLKENGREELKYKFKAIGYLDITEPYEKGIVSQTFVNKLRQIWKSGMTLGSLGFHTCEFCETEPKATSSCEKILVDKENNIKYLFPEMIFHYIEVHEFKPSNEFIKCVMNYNPEEPHYMVEDDIIANNDLKKSKSKGINISQVFDDELAKITDKNISEICKNDESNDNKGI